MENYEQMFNYAKIKLYKNYSNLDLKSVVYETVDCEASPIYIDDDNDDFDFDIHMCKSNPVEVKTQIISLDTKKPINRVTKDLHLFEKTPANFYYTDKPTQEFKNYNKKGSPISGYDCVKLVNVKQVEEISRIDYFQTDSDRQIKRHYNNPFASMEIFTNSRAIKREGNKVTVKKYTFRKVRKLGAKFYKKYSSSTTITFDLEKGNFRIITYKGGTKIKMTKGFFCNSFRSLDRAFPRILDVKEIFEKDSPLSTRYYNVFNDNEFFNKVYEFLELEPTKKVSLVPDKFDVLHFTSQWLELFAKLKRIKMPNNGLRFITCYYPTEKCLKRNDRKLIVSILDRANLLSKINVKLLHEFPGISLFRLSRLCDLFGEDYTKFIGSIDKKFFRQLTPGSQPTNESFQNMGNMCLIEDFQLTKRDKENMVSILSDSVSSKYDKEIMQEMVPTFIDHFRMIRKLRTFYPEICLNARKYDTFNNEHTEISTLERNIQRGYYHNSFDKKIFDEICEPIEVVVYNHPRVDDIIVDEFVDVNRKIYTPVLLTTSEEFVEEGAYMHHCVAGYVNNNNSIIVSLRLENDRITCQFNTKTKNLIQARSFTNTEPPKHFDEPLNKLKNRIRRMYGSINPIERCKVPLKINGVLIDPTMKEEVEVLDFF